MSSSSHYPGTTFTRAPNQTLCILPSPAQSSTLISSLSSTPSRSSSRGNGRHLVREPDSMSFLASSSVLKPLNQSHPSSFILRSQRCHSISCYLNGHGLSSTHDLPMTAASFHSSLRSAHSCCGGHSGSRSIRTISAPPQPL